MRDIYAIDIYSPLEDSLEQVMGQIYTDTFNQDLEERATTAFRSLMQLFTRRIADTTNSIHPTRQRWLYRMLAGFLGSGVAPEDITIITFNQDLQVEKTLCLLAERSRWSKYKDQIFNFPGCYALDPARVTGPTDGQGEEFEISARRDDAIGVLKLHGSLNWYSPHTSATPSHHAMFNARRELGITTRRVVPPDMKIAGKRATYALPVVVPPVAGKSSVLHEDLRNVWRVAEEALNSADELILFGYSCPPLDFESANQLRRSQLRSNAQVSVIDPNGAIAARYIELLRPQSLAYYGSAKAFVGSHPVFR